MDIHLGKAGVMTTGDFDTEKYPIPPVPIEPSLTECRHTPVPESYHSWYEWCEQASKKHRSVMCPKCCKFAIWLTKAEAKAYEKRVREEAKKRSDEIMSEMARRLAKKKK